MKKILFILPCVPYPLTAGGNQAFFNMVEYIRHKMSVSLLLSPENKEMNDVESLRALWTNVDFYLFREEDAEPKTRCPRYYRWLKKMSESISPTNSARSTGSSYSATSGGIVGSLKNTFSASICLSLSS